MEARRGQRAPGCEQASGWTLEVEVPGARGESHRLALSHGKALRVLTWMALGDDDT